MSLADLQPELLDRVAGHEQLASLRGSCRRLRALINQKQQALQLTPDSCADVDGAELQARFPNASTLHLNKWQLRDRSHVKLLTAVLTPAWRSVQQVNWGWNIHVTETVVSLVAAGCPNLQHMSGLHGFDSDKGALLALQGLTALRSLSKLWCSAKVDNMSTVAQLSSLTRLHSDSLVTSIHHTAGLEALCSGTLTNLADLDLGSSYDSHRLDCKVLSRLVSLTRLVWPRPPAERSIVAAAGQLRQLRVLELGQTIKSKTSKCIKHLCDHPSLEVLALRIPLDRYAVGHLATCSALTQLRALNGFMWPCSASDCLPGLQSLVAGGYVAPLKHLAPNLTSLQYLSPMELDAVAGHTALVRLRWHCAIFRPGGDLQSLQSLAGCLTQLLLEFSKHARSSALLEALAPLTNLEELGLCSRRGVSADCVSDKVLKKVLPVLPKLARLQLVGGICLTDACMAPLAAAPALRHVRLTGCRDVTPDGIRALAQAATGKLRQVVLGDRRFTKNYYRNMLFDREALQAQNDAWVQAWENAAEQVSGSFMLTFSTNEEHLE